MSKQIHVGAVAVGGGAPVSIQSMCNTPTQDVERTVSQILRLEGAGCQIIRVAVPDEAAARALDQIKEQHTTSDITLCNTDNQTEVCLCKLLFCLLITFFHTFCQFNFFLCTQKRYFTNFLQVHSDRILDADTVRYRNIDLIYIHVLFQIF